ncbi:zinc finger domain-containing protein [Cordyceps javanica]|uniref:Zinc finger domain-containing protein n=1 Tax=Cordyceps javanica TaxID=43265 RepID=A0A545VBA0_9HYPO|nr:zinc finger domain-containing protein [Cordyceps javanica]TQW10229.1 zinc finger domain-containing protein [Cordyceps javanica]
MEEWTRQRDSVPAPRVTESPKLEPAFRKRFSESFRFNPSPLRRHSLAHSICSSVSSAHFFDSDTTYSASTVASPISTVYESETEDHVCPHFLDRPSSRAVERSRQHFASFDSGSTWVGDRDEEDKISHGELALANQMSPVTPENKSDDDDLDSPDTAQHMIDDDVSMLGSSESGVNEQADAASPRTLICDASSVTTDEAPESDADTLLSYTLQLVYGIDTQDQEPHIRHLRRLTAKYIREVGDSIWHSPAADGEQPHSQGNSYSSSTPSPTENGRRGSQSGHSQSSSKRKPDDGAGGDGSQGSGQGSGLVPVKKARQGIRDEGNLRLSCPFRKRNPSRFNVRDHHSCAMTYFPKFAELRQHIVKQHKRDDPSAFVCDRCNRDFCSRRELREHQRLPKELMCDLADHDPESGIDGPTCNKLLSRKRASGTSPFVQWREIWNLIFPDDDDNTIGTFNFIPVIEHFELASKFHASIDLLRASLQDRIPDQAMLDAVCANFERCFAETVDQCLTAAQELHYVNRSNKKAELGRGTAQQQQQQVARGGSQHVPGIVPRPDSGILLDDGSEESGSVTSSGVRYNGTFRVLSCPDQPAAAFVFGDGGLDTPALSLQTPTSAFNPDMPPAATQLMPLGGSVNSGPQTDFTRLWADEMLYNMTTVDAGNSDVAEQGRWESTPSHMALHESMTPNLF